MCKSKAFSALSFLKGNEHLCSKHLCVFDGVGLGVVVEIDVDGAGFFEGEARGQAFLFVFRSLHHNFSVL